MFTLGADSLSPLVVSRPLITKEGREREAHIGAGGREKKESVYCLWPSRRPIYRGSASLSRLCGCVSKAVDD